MKTLLTKYGAVSIWIITAIAILVSAYVLKGSAYENAWIYLLAIGIVLATAFEVYARKGSKR